MKLRAQKRAQTFGNYKTLKLIKYMKTLIKNQRIFNRTGKISIYDKIKTVLNQQVSIDMFRCLTTQHKLWRLYNKKLIEKFKEKQKEEALLEIDNYDSDSQPELQEESVSLKSEL